MKISGNQIKDLALSNIHISESANISEVKIENGGDFILKDGTRSMESNLNLGNFKIINLANAVNPKDAVNYSQLLMSSYSDVYQFDVRDLQISDTTPIVESVGYRYIIMDSLNLPSALSSLSGIVQDYDIVEYISAQDGWVVSFRPFEYTPTEFRGAIAYVVEKELFYYFTFQKKWASIGNLEFLNVGDGLVKLDPFTLALNIGDGLKFNSGQLEIDFNADQFEIDIDSQLSIKDGGINASNITWDNLGSGLYFDSLDNTLNLKVDSNFFEFDLNDRLTIKNNSIGSSQIIDNSVGMDQLANIWGEGITEDATRVFLDIDDYSLEFNESDQLSVKKIHKEHLGSSITGEGLTQNEDGSIKVNLDPNSLEFNSNKEVSIKLNGDTLEKTPDGLRLRPWGGNFEIIGDVNNQILPIKVIIRGNLLGDQDDSNQDFYTEFLPLEETEEIFKNGLSLTRNIDYSINYSNGIVTFASPPLIADVIRVNYRGLLRS